MNFPILFGSRLIVVLVHFRAGLYSMEFFYEPHSSSSSFECHVWKCAAKMEVKSKGHSYNQACVVWLFSRLQSKKGMLKSETFGDHGDWGEIE